MSSPIITYSKLTAAYSVKTCIREVSDLQFVFSYDISRL